MARVVVPTVNKNGEHNPSFKEQGVNEFTTNYHNLEVIKTDSDTMGVVPRNVYSALVDRSTGVKAQGFYFFGSGNPAVVLGGAYWDTTGFSTNLTSVSLPDVNKKAYFVPHSQAGAKYVAIACPGNTSISGAARHGNLHYTTSGTIAPTAVADVNMPGNNGISNVSGGVSLGGYFFLCDINGQIHNSNLDDITTWNALDFITAEREPDVGMYLGKHRDHVVYIGTSSIEFFYLDPSNVNGSPLSRRTDIHHRVGTTFANSVVEEGDRIYFVGNGQGEAPCIYKLENFQLTKIEIPAIDAFLNTSNTTTPAGNTDIDLTVTNPVDTTVYLSELATANNKHYLYFYKFQAAAFAIDLDLGIISKWYLGGNPTTTVNEDFSERFPIIATSGTSILDISGIASRAKIDSNSIVEYVGGAIPCIYYSDFINFGTVDRKRIESVQLQHYTTADSDLSADYQVDISWKDFNNASANGVADFNTPRTVSTHKYPTRLFRCGSTRQRMFKLDIKDRFPIISGIEIEYDILRN